MKKLLLLLIFIIQFCIGLHILASDTENIKVYYINGFEYQKPSSSCRTSACQSLLKEINSAQKSINFAIYGIENQPEIFNALVNAKNRGVNVKGVTDMTQNHTNIYYDTESLIEKLKTVKTDYDIGDDNSDMTFKQKFDITSAIMHNKFFVFDGKKVWTGSANISGTGTGGYNTNIVVLINSPQVAKLYNQEFNQMYSSKFHRLKNEIQNNTNIRVDNESVVDVYFAPKHRVFKNKLHNLIENAQTSIYVEMFFLTNKYLVEDLINAHKRGVDVKVILDAVSARNNFSGHKRLRAEGIEVKVENWGGKMHTKGATIDDKYFVIGSMNWTGKAEFHNDENLLIINSPTIAKDTKEHFFILWNKIPDKYLKYDPSAESPASIGSCEDGIDNDFDGYTDLDDPGCKNYHKK